MLGDSIFVHISTQTSFWNDLFPKFVFSLFISITRTEINIAWKALRHYLVFSQITHVPVPGVPTWYVTTCNQNYYPRFLHNVKNDITAVWKPYQIAKFHQLYIPIYSKQSSLLYLIHSEQLGHKSQLLFTLDHFSWISNIGLTQACQY